MFRFFSSRMYVIHSAHESDNIHLINIYLPIYMHLSIAICSLCINIYEYQLMKIHTHE